MTKMARASIQRDDEDWTKIQELSTRRRLQNRISQRNHSQQDVALCRPYETDKQLQGRRYANVSNNSKLLLRRGLDPRNRKQYLPRGGPDRTNPAFSTIERRRMMDW